MTAAAVPTVIDELAVLEALVPLQQARILEAGCGAARLARDLVRCHETAEMVGIEVDDRQLAKNLLEPAQRLRFERAGAEAIPFGDAFFDGAMMLKSLHHVPTALMDKALSEVVRVLRPGAWLYVSEPVFAGPLNELIRLFNDEGEVRAAAQAALDRAIASGQWLAEAERRFEMPVSFANFEQFEQRMMRPTFADHGIDDTMIERVRQRFAPHQDPVHGTAHFTRPMHARLLRKAH